MKIKRALCFDDVLLVPKFSNINSRSEVDTTIFLGGDHDDSKQIKLDIPIISSPMDTVTDYQMAAAMSKLGGLGIIHRYNTVTEQSDAVRDAITLGAGNIGIAVGCNDEGLRRAILGVNAGANVICVDIAHGHHSLMKETLEILKRTFGSQVHLMAGNVATLDGINALAEWGADSVRVGVGGGSICSTRIQTGHGVPTLQSVMDCSLTTKSVNIIADGGIKNSGDIVKSIAAGADAVMLGSLLAGTDEAPGHINMIDGVAAKVYRGMASKDAQIDWRGHYSSIEGVTSRVKYSGPLENVVGELVQGIRSGYSYSGCRNIKEFMANADFILQTAMGNKESNTHILDR